MMAASLVAILLTGTLVLYHSKALWHMESPNARAWNATLNGTAMMMPSGTVTSIITVIAIIFIAVAILGAVRGFA